MDLHGERIPLAINRGRTNSCTHSMGVEGVVTRSKASWSCDRSIVLVASDTMGGLGVDVEEVEHHVPVGGALRCGVLAPLQRAGEGAWWRHWSSLMVGSLLRRYHRQDQ